MANKKQIRVFIGSPGDLSAERNAFRKQTEQLNRGFGDGANVEFVPLGWEDSLASTGPRAQSVINQLVDSCDVFILTLHRRWGQDSPDSEYSSYTEEEFHRALERYKNDKSPIIFVFFKGVDSGSLATPDPQLQKVINFKLELEETRSTIYKEFFDLDGFGALLDQHLRAFAKGEIPYLEAGDFQTPLPLNVRQELQDARKELVLSESQIKAEIAKAIKGSHKELLTESLALELAQAASDLAIEGKIEKSKIMFAKALQGSGHHNIIYSAAQFQLRIGNLAEADELFSRGLANVEERHEPLFLMGQAALANIHGDNTIAESLFHKILKIETKLNRPIGVASSYGNLGNIYKDRGDLKQAEEMYQKALVILEKHGHEEMMAVQYNNLGLVFQIRGDLDQSDNLIHKALTINKKIGNQERVAVAYSNLGNNFRMRKQLDQAEAMYLKALALDEKNGYLRGQASDLNNLGIIHKNRGHLGQAEEQFRKALPIYEQLNDLEGMAVVYINLGGILLRRGNPEQAKTMYFSALDIDKKTGNKMGMGISYCSLGKLFLDSDDRIKAEQFLKKALDLFNKIGAKDRIDETEKNLTFLNENRIKRFIRRTTLNLLVNKSSIKETKS